MKIKSVAIQSLYHGVLLQISPSIQKQKLLKVKQAKFMHLHEQKNERYM